MAFIIVVSNAWGLLLGEWRGVSKGTLAVVLSGISTILLAVYLVGYGAAL
jgi:L-rhamnose-H+ transport protein